MRPLKEMGSFWNTLYRNIKSKFQKKSSKEWTLTLLCTAGLHPDKQEGEEKCNEIAKPSIHLKEYLQTTIQLSLSVNKKKETAV